MDVLNRAALVVIKKEPFVKWINETAKELGGSPVTIEGANSEPSVYLIPNFGSPDDFYDVVETYLKETCGEIFEKELSGWYHSPPHWPKIRDFQTFTEWFDVSIHSMVYDHADGEPLELEEE